MRPRIVDTPLRRYILGAGRNKNINPGAFAEKSYHLGRFRPGRSIKDISQILSDSEPMHSAKRKLLEVQVLPQFKRNRTLLRGLILVLSSLAVGVPAYLITDRALDYYKTLKAEEQVKEEAEQQGAALRKQLEAQKQADRLLEEAALTHPPLTISTESAEYLESPDNLPITDLLKNCRPLSANRWGGEKYTEDDLQGCLSGDLATFIQYLKIMGEETVWLPYDANRSSQSLEARLKRVPDLKLSSRSAAISDDPFVVMSEPSGRVPPNYAEVYCRIYGVSPFELPENLKEKVFFIPYFNDAVQPNWGSQSFLFRLVKETAQGGILITYNEIHPTMPGLFFPLERLKPALAFVNQFRADLDQAARLLHAAHPDIHEENFKAALYKKLMMELWALNFEDPWQDVSACEHFGCQFLPQFRRELSSVEYGVWVNDRLERPDWQLATWLHTEIERQGFGPFQIVFGLVRESLRDPSILEHFSGWLSPADFVNTEATIRTLLDPRKAAYTWAMLVDFVLKQLKATVFSDPQVAIPSDESPYISDLATAREYSMLALADALAGHPERSARAKEHIFYPTDLHVQSFFMKDIFGINPYFPGLSSRRINMGNTVIYLPLGNVRKEDL